MTGVSTAMGARRRKRRTSRGDAGEATGGGGVDILEVTQRYGDVVALSEISLEIAAGEFVTLLGPSGCGKTTLLRLIAGFVSPTSGRIRLNGRDITPLPAHLRPINMVFQRPALFPHLDVQGNIGFGLKLERHGKRQIRAHVAEALRLVQLEGFEGRRAHELSGGQMQRVALARALVKRPEVLLLDEPLSALDLRIRLDLETELRRVHRETGATFVYVTHDQREALSLSDRVAVFDHGRIEQVGTPRQVYRDPKSAFAARFVGDANVLRVDVVHDGEKPAADLGPAKVPLAASMSASKGPAWLVVRPETVRVAPPGSGEPQLLGVVEDVAFRGTGVDYRIRIEGIAESIKAEMPAAAPWEAGIGAPVGVTWDADAIRLLPRDGE